MSAPTLRPMEHTGDSANIAYYRERGAKPDESFIWASVLRSVIRRNPDTGEREARPGPSIYYVTVNHTGKGKIGETTVKPSRDPKGPLTPRQVGRAVRDVLADAQ